MKLKINSIIFITIVLYLISFFYRYDAFTMTPFRESQTAISIYYLFNNISINSVLNYETPLFGYPWKMPFEFPLYQLIVALLINQQEINEIIIVSKVVSMIFMIAFVYFLYSLLCEIGANKKKATQLAIITLMSPVYISYSPSVMIESTALIFGLLFLKFYINFYKTNLIYYLMMSLLFSIMAILAKSTTWVLFAIILINSAAYYLYNLFKGNIVVDYLKIFKYLISLLVVIILPLAIGMQWIEYTDTIKENIYFSKGLTSFNLKDWNYGSLSQRLSPEFWFVIILKLIFMSTGLLFLVLIFFYKRIFNGISKVEGGGILFISVLSVFMTLALFPNLYYRHDYYFYAISWILVGAITWILLEVNIVKSNLILISIFILIGSGLYLTVKKNYYSPSDIAAVEVLNSYEIKSPIIIFNKGFSSYIPFHSKRRALMIDGLDDYDSSNEYFDINKKIEWGAILYRENSVVEANNIINKFNLKFKYKLNYYGDYWIATHKKIISNNYLFDKKLQLHIDIFNKIINNKKLSSGFLRYFDISFGLNNGGFSPSLTVVIGRGADIFYIDFFAPIFIRF